jgi:serine/threonine-protein kinase
MNGAAVFLVAFFTSAATSLGTVYIAERLNLFQTEAAPTVTVPNLEGLPQSDAMNNLNNLGLVLMIGGREPSADLADNTIVRQSLPAGQSVNKGQAITVTLAKALPKVPQVVGKSQAQATAALLEAGYRAEPTDPIHHDTIPEGQVISQTPEPGTALAEQKSVQITVSKGVGDFEVPKVIGLTYTKAKAALEDKGLKLKIRWVNLAETASNIVLRQTPEPGSKTSKDTEVEVVINRD